jgi:hypothetical protein
LTFWAFFRDPGFPYSSICLETIWYNLCTCDTYLKWIYVTLNMCVYVVSICYFFVLHYHWYSFNTYLYKRERVLFVSKWYILFLFRIFLILPFLFTPGNKWYITNTNRLYYFVIEKLYCIENIFFSVNT